MGHVALKAFVFLHEALRAENLAYIEEPEFFRVPGVSIQDGLVQSTLLPWSGFYYWKRAGAQGDLLFFVGDQQPVAGKEYELAMSLLEFAEDYGVKRIVTAAAMPTAINHYQPSQVWVTATHEELLSELTPYCQRVLREGQLPSTLHVRGTNFCDIGWRLEPRTGSIIAISAIDNLTRGAAGQAICNMNLVLGFDEDTGLNLRVWQP